jgi:hypothetical protein
MKLIVVFGPKCGREKKSEPPTAALTLYRRWVEEGTRCARNSPGSSTSDLGYSTELRLPYTVAMQRINNKLNILFGNLISYQNTFSLSSQLLKKAIFCLCNFLALVFLCFVLF